MFLGFPVIATQIYAFVAPGLYKKERKAFIPYLMATPVFFVLGAAMVYFAVMPMAMHFFLGMQQMAKARRHQDADRTSEYLGFTMTLIIAFGICFQLPVILTLLARIELVTRAQLGKGRQIRHRRHPRLRRLHHAARSDQPDRPQPADVPLYEFSIIVRWIERWRRKAAAAG